MIRLFRWLSATLLALMIIACSGPSEEEQAAEKSTRPAPGPDAAAIAANNRGVGLMGRFEYEPAREVFSKLAEQYPAWLDVKVNLAIARLNRQEEGDEQAALGIVDTVLAAEPGNLRAHYVAGLLRLYLSSPADAQGHFRQVAEADPQDAYAAYYLAQCLAQAGDHPQALEWYRRAMGLDPYLRSAYYGTFQTLRRLRQAGEARRVIGDYQRLANNPRARLAEFKYTRMGPKGEALAIDLRLPSEPDPIPEGPVFAGDRKVLGDVLSGGAAGGALPISITAADIQGDGELDLFVAGAARSGDGPNLMLMGQAGGAYAPQPDHPLAGVSDVNAALWGDFDNDGLIDAYLCRRGANRLWHQTGPGRWEDVTGTTGTSGGERNTVDGLFFDADHDGDLDLFLVNDDGPNELLSNNLDGSFRPLAKERGIGGDGRSSLGAVPVDLDGDRDVDIIVINREPPHEIYLNDRLWAYRAAAGLEQFRNTPALAALAGDLDADGIPELYAVQPQGKLYRWRQDVNGELQPEALTQVASPGTAWVQLAIQDVNGDGRLDILAASPGGWSAIGPTGDGTSPLFEARPAGSARLQGWAPVLPAPEQGPAVVALGTDGRLSIWPPGGGRFPFLALTLSGVEDQAQSVRSNASGIGARVAVRVDSRWTLVSTFPNGSGPGQSAQPLAVGLGGAAKADFIAIDWSDGVFQSELGLAPGPVQRIAETQRQLSSCPVLFAWDGERYAFVSDLLGVGGLGYAVGPGEYATPRPWENLLLPPGLLKPRDGRYRLKLAEPMEETAYLDAARLVAYDLPPGWQMVLDERMGIRGPGPTGEPRYYRRELSPERVVNERGQDVTWAVIDLDGRAATVGALDRRFIGRLAREHVLTLSFPEALDTASGEPMLVADGWVEYPYSQTLFAAWQAGAGYHAPTLEARCRDGRWRTVWEEFGYPAGMPRRMSVPLRDLPDGTRALRLRTNQQIYWDRLAVAYAEPLPGVRRRVLPLQGARVAKTGFARRTTAAQFRPHYDYARRRPFWDTRYMAGYYTRLGDTRALVAAVDDALAIIGAGEEVHLEYGAQEGPLPEGWRRHFVLESNGWTKDMDLYTRDGETVGPLPDTGRPRGERDRLHARYNTRYLAGR